MVSSPNHTFSWASLNLQFTSIRAHSFACNWLQPFLNDSAEGRRMIIEIISWSISTKVWDREGFELSTPWSAVRLASVARHVTDCATRPGKELEWQGRKHFTLYLIEMPFNAFANRAHPDQAALVRAAWSGSTLFAYGNNIRYDPTLVDLTSNFFVLCTSVKVYLYIYS